MYIQKQEIKNVKKRQKTSINQHAVEYTPAFSNKAKSAQIWK